MSFDVLVIDPPSAMHIATIINTSLGKKKSLLALSRTHQTRIQLHLPNLASTPQQC